MFVRWQGWKLAGSKLPLISRSSSFHSAAQSLNNKCSILPKKTMSLNEMKYQKQDGLILMDRVSYARLEFTLFLCQLTHPPNYLTLKSHFFPLFSTI